MAKLLRNPIRTTGALLINPRRKRKKAHGRRRRNGGRLGALLLTNPRRRRKSRRSSSRRHNPHVKGYSRKAHRVKAHSVRAYNRKARKGRSRRRRNPSRRGGMFRRFRMNPRRRYASRRRTSARRYRHNPHASIVNPRRHKARSRRRVAFRRRNPAMGKGLAKIPVIGPLLASMIGVVGPAAFGAVGVEPILAVSQLAARYAPNLPTTALYPLSGLFLAAATDLYIGKWIGLKPELRRNIAVALAAGGGAVGYYKWRTGQGATAGEEMGALILSGLGSPIAGAVMGDLGDLIVQAPSYGALLEQQNRGMGDYGPMWVSPMNTLPAGSTI